MGCFFYDGGESLIVGELRGVVCFELEAFPEPKALRKEDLEALLPNHGSISVLARYLRTGCSSVQERLKPTRKWVPKTKMFVKVKSIQKNKRPSR
jgi:hypothetical protein